MSERALVTGGAGFIGSRLVRRLLDGGHEVTILDSLVEAVHGVDARVPEEVAGARFVRGDVRDEAAWLDALDGVEAVYHLAAETGTGESMYRSRRYVDVNVGGTALLCDLVQAGRAPSVRRVVLASSRAVYGEGPYACAACGEVDPRPRSAEQLAAGRWDPLCPVCGAAVTVRPARAGAPPRPTSVYGMTKRDQEELIHLLLPSAGVEAVSLRLQNVYGPGQSLRNPYTGILSIFSVRFLEGRGVRIFEDGRESRDFVYVDDVVEALVRAGEVVLPAGHTVVDVGSGVATSVLSLARQLAARYGAGDDAIEITGEYRAGDIRHALADTTALRRLLGIVPRTPLDEGLDAFAAWVRAEDRPASTLDRALDEMEASGLLGRTGPEPAGP